MASAAPDSRSCAICPDPLLRCLTKCGLSGGSDCLKTASAGVMPRQSKSLLKPCIQQRVMAQRRSDRSYLMQSGWELQYIGLGRQPYKQSIMGQYASIWSGGQINLESSGLCALLITCHMMVSTVPSRRRRLCGGIGKWPTPLSLPAYHARAHKYLSRNVSGEVDDMLRGCIKLIACRPSQGQAKAGSAHPRASKIVLDTVLRGLI